MDESEVYYRNTGEIEALVSSFENCTIAAAEFTHGAHLVLALSYLHLSGLTVSEATNRMREGLHRFIDHHSVDRQKYNETITIFWIKLIRNFLNMTDAARSVAEVANEMLETYGDSKLIFTYYSKDHLLSEEAREGWIEPDLKQLDF